MKIATNALVSIRYIMKNSKGDILENTMEGEPVRYLHGSGEILPALEAELVGLKSGDKKSIALSRKNGFTDIEEPFHFEVLVVDVQSFSDKVSDKSSENMDCGPGCCC